MDLFITSDELLIWQSFLILCIILWIYCLVDVLKSQFPQNEKLIWALAVIFVPFLGTILYLIIGRRKKLKLN
ncbi:PLD nuclease N-terminal domain-containing protein [Psychroflexus aestuariivivens]|uniref:PLD nuclease N-terminal domain-containing protein n=1 Tax=Psychroflexus aestuariivivens TaxID=1795040 RepID=UPI000FDBE402|nr:PLD nuclease N-terminal domain-containing protein [Psychroflexus aestuariivivens]